MSASRILSKGGYCSGSGLGASSRLTAEGSAGWTAAAGAAAEAVVCASTGAAMATVAARTKGILMGTRPLAASVLLCGKPSP